MSQLLQFYKSFQQSRAPATKSAPTFEDLTIDDSLSEHQRVVRYAKSTIGLQRLVHVKMLADVAKSIDFDSMVMTIIPLLEPLSKDIEPVVKQHLVEQLKFVAKICHDTGGEEGYTILLETILPITASLLEDEKPEIRQSASMTLVDIAPLIKDDDIGQHVLTIILRLAHEDDKEEMRMTASQLLNLLAETLGHDLCKQFVIPEVVSLAEDPVFRVRKSTALNFHNICKVGGEHELLERLMPAFVRLSKDDMYRVRRACAESLSDISKNVSEVIRLGVLVEIFLRLTHDPSKLVKQSILQQSGMFIATLPSRAVTETILSQYCSMVASPTNDLAVDAELRHICAYCFPAVFQVISKERWHEIREVYHTLAQSRNTNTKQTLAHSLHEVARILDDPILVEEELIPLFEDMIQDVETVQMGIIKHLAQFLTYLPEPCRVSYLPLLHDILHSTNPFNWRLRQHLAVQLPVLVRLPPKQDVYRTLFPTVMILLQDPVASVRRDSFSGVTTLINILHGLASVELGSEVEADFKEKEELKLVSRQNLEEVAVAINSFNSGDKYQLRQLWIELCTQLLKDLPISLFEEFFLQGVLTLTSDPVSNVRVALSFFFVGWPDDCLPPWETEKDEPKNETEKKTPQENQAEPIKEPKKKESGWHWLLKRADIRQCIERLSKDDNDVYLNLSRLQPMYPDISFESFSCRGRKTAPGGITPINMNGGKALTAYEMKPPLQQSLKVDLKTENETEKVENDIDAEITSYTEHTPKHRLSKSYEEGTVDISHPSDDALHLLHNFPSSPAATRAAKSLIDLEFRKSGDFGDLKPIIADEIDLIDAVMHENENPNNDIEEDDEDEEAKEKQEAELEKLQKKEGNMGDSRDIEAFDGEKEISLDQIEVREGRGFSDTS